MASKPKPTPAKRTHAHDASDAASTTVRSVHQRVQPPPSDVGDAVAETAAAARGGGGGDAVDDAAANEAKEELEEKTATVDRALAIKLATFVNQTTLSFPEEVPLQYPFMANDFYVRPCYVDYYDYVLSRLTNTKKRGVTVTGTPGIGKSVFMGYFFLRYTLEHTDATIIMVSYDKQSVIQEVRRWKGGDVKVVPAATFPVQDVWIEYPNAIVLMDGPPRTRPVNLPYVVFMSPNERWFSTRENDFAHERVVMPLWSEQELLDAVDALQLQDQLDPLDVAAFMRRDDERHRHEVLYRYDLFGGVARACLQTELKLLATQRDSLINAATTIGSMAAQATIDGGALEVTRHRLCHYVPFSDDCTSWVPKVASPYVQQLLTRRVDALEGQERARFKAMLEQVPSARGVFGIIRENDAHRLLADGLYLVALHLASAGRGARPGEPSLTLQILRSDPNGAVTKQIARSKVSGGPYFKPASKTFESVDGFYLIQPDKDRAQDPWGAVKVVLFQVTVSSTHPVKAKGLYAVLKGLGIQPTAYSQDVALVFAVQDADKYNRQRIVVSPAYTDTSSITAITGVGDSLQRALEGTTVCTVGHLRKRPTHAVLDNDAQLKAYERAQTLLKAHDEKAVTAGSDIHRALEAIPQFAWEIGRATTSVA